MRRVRLCGAASDAPCLEMVSKGDNDCMAEIFESAGANARQRDGARRPPCELISRVPGKVLVFAADPKAPGMAIGIRHSGIEMSVRDGVLTVVIASAGVPIIVNIVSDA